MGGNHHFDDASRLAHETARDALAAARMALHDAALEMEAEVGGLMIGTLALGIGTIARTHVATFVRDGILGRRTIAELAQVGYHGGGLPTRLWLDVRGWIYAETALDRIVPVARSWQELVEIALLERGDVGTDAHTFVAAFGGWRHDDLAVGLDLAVAAIPTGERRVAWDTEAVRICFGTELAVASTWSLADLARMALDAQVLEPDTTLTLLGERPSGAVMRGGEPRVFGVVSTDTPQNLRFLQSTDGVVGWDYCGR